MPIDAELSYDRVVDRYGVWSVVAVLVGVTCGSWDWGLKNGRVGAGEAYR